MFLLGEGKKKEKERRERKKNVCSALFFLELVCESRLELCGYAG